jgi:hypothetical protein
MKHSIFDQIDAQVRIHGEALRGLTPIAAISGENSNEGIRHATISQAGTWEFAWGNSSHNSATLTWLPENSGKAAGGNGPEIATSGGVSVPGLSGVHIVGPEAAGLGAYVGTFDMVGSCGVAVYTGLAANPVVVVTGAACADQAYTQYENGNLMGVLTDIAYAQSLEMDAMSGGLAGIGDQIAPSLGTGPASETGANGWTCAGNSPGSWGNNQTFDCTSSPSLGSPSVTIRLDFNNDVVGVNSMGPHG